MILSVIVPVYNVENYIQECISSILSINIDDMEVIVVDDGSTDNSILKVKEIEDSRIKIISQKNKGLSGARNKGLDLAKGKYIYFIDSDDFIQNPEALTNMIEMAEKNELDCVMGNGYYYWDVNKKRKIYDGDKKPKENIITNVENYISDSLKNDYYQDMVWLNIYKKDILIQNNIQFSEGHYHEDVDWTLKFLLSAKKIGFLDNDFYMYRQRDGSITKNNNIEKMLKLSEDKIYMAKKIYELSKDLSNKELKNILHGRSTELYFAGAISGRKIETNFFRKIERIPLYKILYRKELRKWIRTFSFSPELAFKILNFKERKFMARG